MLLVLVVAFIGAALTIFCLASFGDIGPGAQPKNHPSRTRRLLENRRVADNARARARVQQDVDRQLRRVRSWFLAPAAYSVQPSLGKSLRLPQRAHTDGFQACDDILGECCVTEPVSRVGSRTRRRKDAKLKSQSANYERAEWR